MCIEMIRLRLHTLINEIEDSKTLKKLYAEALEFKYAWMEEDPFSEETWAEIEEGLAQIQNDEPCTFPKAIEQFRRWQYKD